MKGLYWRIRIMWMALKWVTTLNLGDVVIYKGKRYVLNQGVCSPYWDMGAADGGEYLKRIHENDFTKERTLKNYLGSFRSGYRFFMGYWFDIWARNWTRQ